MPRDPQTESEVGADSKKHRIYASDGNWALCRCGITLRNAVTVSDHFWNAGYEAGITYAGELRPSVDKPFFSDRD